MVIDIGNVKRPNQVLFVEYYVLSVAMSVKLPRNNCRACGKEVSRPEKIYCGGKCEKDYFYVSYIVLWLVGLETGCVLGGVSKYVKRWLFSTRGEKCERCGWCAVHPVTGKVPVEIDHIDGNWQNCRPENLQILCPNCHSLTPTFRGLNRGNGRELRRIGSAATAAVL